MLLYHTKNNLNIGGKPTAPSLELRPPYKWTTPYPPTHPFKIHPLWG